MLQRRFLVTTIGLVLCLLTAVAQTTKKNSDYEPILLPSGKHFPTSQSALMKLRDDQDVPGMHSHAWDIFASLTSKSLPIWETWFTKCDAGVLSPDCDLATRSSQPTSRRLKFLKSFEIPNQVILEFQRAVPIDTKTTFSNRPTSDILFSQFLDQFEKRPSNLHPSCLILKAKEPHSQSKPLHARRNRRGLHQASQSALSEARV